MTSQQPVLGIIRLDEDAADESSIGPLERSFLPPVPLRSAIAKGADAVANTVPTTDAVNGILDAASRLDGQTQLIIGSCGYMWASREHLRGMTATPLLTSGLELLDLALRMTNRPVGVITWDEEPLVPLLRDHAGWDRLRLLSVGDLPDWKKTVDLSGYMKPGGWTLDRMADQLTKRLAGAFAEGGVFEDVGILVLECAMVPRFRSAIRSVTSLAILDIVHFAQAALE